MEFVYLGIGLVLIIAVIAGYVYNKKNTETELKGFEYLRKTERDKLEGKRILCIGNSYGDDSVKYIPNIMQSYGMKNIIVANLYIGGCSLERHAQNARSGEKAYEYRKWKDGEWSNTSNTSLEQGVVDEDWDVIVFQQQSAATGRWQTYQPHLNELIAFVRSKNINARLAFNMTWAYPYESKSTQFVQYNNDTDEMFKKITGVVGSRIESDYNFDFVIPTGTAVHNARDCFGLFRDDIHLNEKGRFLASLMWVKELYDVKAEDLTYTPEEVTQDEAEIFIQAVNNAYEHPYVARKCKAE